MGSEDPGIRILPIHLPGKGFFSHSRPYVISEPWTGPDQFIFKVHLALLLLGQIQLHRERPAILISQYVSGLQEETIETVDTWIVGMLRKCLLDLLRESDNVADGVLMFKAYTEYVAEQGTRRAGYDLLDSEEGEE